MFVSYSVNSYVSVIEDSDGSSDSYELINSLKMHQNDVSLKQQMLFEIGFEAVKDLIISYNQIKCALT